MLKDTQNLKVPTILLMVTTAGVYDLISLIPGAGTLLCVPVGVGFFIWFKQYGIQFNSPQRIIAMIVGVGGEAIPVLDMLPLWTAAVIYTIVTDKVPVLKTVTEAAGGKIAKAGKGAAKDAAESATKDAIAKKAAGGAGKAVAGSALKHTGNEDDRVHLNPEFKPVSERTAKDWSVIRQINPNAAKEEDVKYENPQLSQLRSVRPEIRPNVVKRFGPDAANIDGIRRAA